MWNKKKNEIERLDQFCSLQTQQLGERIALIDRLLAGFEGCQRHPSYRAVRKPTSDCQTCRDLYALRLELNAQGLAVRSGARGKNRAKKED